MAFNSFHLGFDADFDRSAPATRAKTVERVLLSVAVLLVSLVPVGGLAVSWWIVSVIAEVMLWRSTDPELMGRRPGAARTLRVAASAVAASAWVFCALLMWFAGTPVSTLLAIALLAAIALYVIASCHETPIHMIAAGTPPALGLLSLPLWMSDTLTDRILLSLAMALLVSFGVSSAIGSYKAHTRLKRTVTDRIREQERLARAEEQLRHVQKMEAMGQLTGGMAHDFNNLLTPILGALDILERKAIGGDREQRLIAGALQSAERAKTLVQRLLAFARRQPLQATAVDVGELICGMADLVSSTIGPQIRVLVEIQPGLPPAKADPNQLEMALLNLAVNARDAMAEVGVLRLTADLAEVSGGDGGGLRPGGYIRVSVADTGTGMDEATIARATEPFFSTKGVGQGTGLGLSMVHGLAQQLGGDLRIRSRPGLGTNVELWLPRSEEAVASPDAQSATRTPAIQRGSVLLVDDEDLVRASTAEMLVDMGYEVREACSAEEALSLINGGLRPGIVITDHLMPGMTGVDLAASLQTMLPGTPVLLVSGFAEHSGIDLHLPLLSKPFRNSELARSISALL